MLGMLNSSTTTMPPGTPEMGHRSAYPFNSFISSMHHERLFNSASSPYDRACPEQGSATEPNPRRQHYDVSPPMLDYRMSASTSSPTCLELDSGMRWRRSCAAAKEEPKAASAYDYSPVQYRHHQDISFRSPCAPQLQRNYGSMPVHPPCLSSTSGASWTDQPSRRQRNDDTVRSSSTGSASSFDLNDCRRTRMFPQPTEPPSLVIGRESTRQVTSSALRYGNDPNEHRMSVAQATPLNSETADHRYVTSASANSCTGDERYESHIALPVVGDKQEQTAGDVTSMYSPRSNYYADYRCSDRDVTSLTVHTAPGLLTAPSRCVGPDVQQSLGEPALDTCTLKPNRLVTSEPRWSLPADYDVVSFKMTSSTSIGKTRTRDKYRTVYTEPQRIELEAEYQRSTYVSAQRKADIALSVGLSERQVKIWFQNRRAKDRRSERKRRLTVTGNATTTEKPAVADMCPETGNGSSSSSSSSPASSPRPVTKLLCDDSVEATRSRYYAASRSPRRTDNAPPAAESCVLFEAAPPQRLAFNCSDSLFASHHHHHHHRQYYV